jgi:predicted small secreted protein
MNKKYETQILNSFKNETCPSRLKRLIIVVLISLFSMSMVVSCSNTLKGMEKDINNLGDDHTTTQTTTTVTTTSQPGVTARTITTDGKPPITSPPPPSPPQ